MFAAQLFAAEINGINAPCDQRRVRIGHLTFHRLQRADDVVKRAAAFPDFTGMVRAIVVTHIGELPHTAAGDVRVGFNQAGH